MSIAPKQDMVKPGAYVASIAHAIFVCRHPVLSHEQSWDRCNYNVQDSEGSRGTISFMHNRFVGASFYNPSPGNALQDLEVVDTDRHLVGIPPDLRTLAMTETFQYLVEEIQGPLIPVITAAFWSDGVHDLVQHVGHWDDVLANGACLFRNQFLPVDQAIEVWAEELALSDVEAQLAMSIHGRRINDLSKGMTLPLSEVKLLKDLATGDAGWNACKEAFAELRIRIE